MIDRLADVLSNHFPDFGTQTEVVPRSAPLTQEPVAVSLEQADGVLGVCQLTGGRRLLVEAQLKDGVEVRPALDPGPDVVGPLAHLARRDQVLHVGVGAPARHLHTRPRHACRSGQVRLTRGQDDHQVGDDRQVGIEHQVGDSHR